MNRLHLGIEEALERRRSDTSLPQSYDMTSNLEFAHPHFAIIYLDHNGELQVETSPSIAGRGGVIFTPNVIDRFMVMAVPTTLATMQFNPNLNQTSPSPWGVQPNTGWVHAGQPRSAELIPCEWQAHQSRRKRRDMRRTGVMLPRPKPIFPPHPPPLGRTVLRVGNRDLLRRYYEKAFEDFQQLNCRVIAKPYIKLVEPRKQIHFPYNGRRAISNVSQRVDPEQTKPGWWPAGVAHREPDHLLKCDRLRLLVHILCELKNSHGVTADKLREAGQDVRRQITPANRLKVLDEIYFVRQMEERYLDGEIAANTPVQVTQTHLPGAIYQEDEVSSRIHTAPTALDTEQGGHDPNDKQNSPLDNGHQLTYSGHQGLPLSPAMSESSVPYSPTFGTYPVGMAPSVLPRESSTIPEHMPGDSNCLLGYYGQQLVPTENPPGYSSSMPHISQVSRYG